MRIIRIAEQPKSSASITKCNDGGYIISIAIENDGVLECDSIMIPKDVKLNLNDLKA